MTKEEAINIIKSECYVFNPLNFDVSSRINLALDMAIKALEQEPCEDAISRRAVKELFQEGSVMGVYHFLGIDELPSVTPKKDGWIPCSERLPKQNEFIDNVRKYYLVQDEYGDMYVATYTNRGWFSIDNLYVLDGVVAWMPLPEPYRAESEGEE